MTEPVNESVENFSWLIDRFVRDVRGVEHAVVVSSDGLVLTHSSDFPEEHAEQLAAIASGLHSLAVGGAGLFQRGECEQLLVRFNHGHLFIMAISDGSCMAVLTAPGTELKLVGFQMAKLVENVAHVLTPQLRSQLREVIQN